MNDNRTTAFAAAATCPPTHCRRPSSAFCSSSRSHKATQTCDAPLYRSTIVSLSLYRSLSLHHPLTSDIAHHASLTLASKSSGVSLVNFSKSCVHRSTANSSPVSVVYMKWFMNRYVQYTCVSHGGDHAACNTIRTMGPHMI